MPRPLHTLTLTLAALLLTFSTTGCEAKHPKTTEAAIRMLNKKIDQVSGMLRTIKKKEDAVDIAPRIQKIAEDIEALSAEVKALPVPAPAEVEAIKKADEALVDAAKLFRDQVVRIHNSVPEAESVLFESLKNFGMSTTRFSFDADPNFKIIEQNMPSQKRSPDGLPMRPEMPKPPAPPPVDRRPFDEKLTDFKAAHADAVVLIELNNMPADTDLGELMKTLRDTITNSGTMSTLSGSTGKVAISTSLTADQVATKLTFGTPTVDAGVITLTADQGKVPRKKK